jgi:hypothetical protein
VQVRSLDAIKGRWKLHLCPEAKAAKDAATAEAKAAKDTATAEVRKHFEATRLKVSSACGLKLLV